MATFDDLISQLRSSDPEKVREAALALGDLGDRRAVPALIDILRESWNPDVWNGAAVALRDLGDPRAVDALIERIRDPKTEKSRGTLVYALQVFDCLPHAELLLELVLTGNFEVSREASDALEAVVPRLDSEQWQRFRQRLSSALLTAPEERAVVLQSLLAI
jgi:HEAT repeat protein